MHRGALGVHAQGLGTTELFPILTQAISRQRFYTRPQVPDHYEARYALDLHLEREVVQADGFNVLNSGEITPANTALNSDPDRNSLTKYGTPLSRQPPRQLRLSVGLRW